MTCTIDIIPEIASGHDNAAGLVRVNTVTDTNGAALTDPIVLFSRSTRGQARTGLGGYNGRVGKPSQVWVFPFLLLAQYKKLKDDYEETSGGAVTVKTTLDGITYANYNATLFMPDYSELEFDVLRSMTWVERYDITGIGFSSVPVTIRGIVAI